MKNIPAEHEWNSRTTAARGLESQRMTCVENVVASSRLGGGGDAARVRR